MNIIKILWFALFACVALPTVWCINYSSYTLKSLTASWCHSNVRNTMTSTAYISGAQILSQCSLIKFNKFPLHHLCHKLDLFLPGLKSGLFSVTRLSVAPGGVSKKTLSVHGNGQHGAEWFAKFPNTANETYPGTTIKMHQSLHGAYPHCHWK